METAQAAAPIVDATPKTDQGNVEVKGDLSAPDTSGMTKEEAREAIRKFKVKVDGQELEVDENELVKGYSHQRAANKRMQEAIKVRKQAEDFINMLNDKNKLFDVIKQLGHDPRKLTEEYLASQLEEEMLDPKEREYRNTKAELQKMKELEKMREEEVKKSRIEFLKQKFSENYTQQFTEALQQVKLPAKKHTVAEMAKYIQRAAKLGYEMNALEAAKLVEEDIREAQRALIGDADGEMLIKLLGEDVANKVRKWDTSRVKNPEQFLKTPEVQAPREERAKRTERRPMTQAEWREYNRR